MSSLGTGTDELNSATEAMPLHPLEFKWTLWFYENQRGRDWKQNMHEVYTYDTVEEFWRLFNHIKPVSEIGIGNDYSVFKEGIKPMWEDERNKEGGRWVINFDNRTPKEKINELWIHLLLSMIGELFDEYGDEINGAFVNSRQRGDKLSLWIADSNKKEEILEIGRRLKTFLKLPPELKIMYEKHADSQTRTGSKAKPSFVL